MAAAAEYRRKACEFNNTAALCAAQGITYEPVVFTVQGSIEKRAEAILSQLADRVAEVEGKDGAAVKAELLERPSITIARHAANAIIKRQAQAPGACRHGRSAFLWTAVASGSGDAFQ